MSERGAALLLGVLAATLAGLLAWAVLVIQPVPGVAPLVAQRLADSGVQSPVTAVLLNFRAHDTLLEVGVLLLAVIATLSLAPRRRQPDRLAGPHRAPSPMLHWFVARLAPVGVVVAGYLWWAGASIPGGAFQGGTVLGASAVLLLLAERLHAPRAGGVGLRLALTLGYAVFLAVGLGVMLLGRAFLEYPYALAKPLIVLIEVAVTLSIGACLLMLVVGVRGARA